MLRPTVVSPVFVIVCVLKALTFGPAAPVNQRSSTCVALVVGFECRIEVARVLFVDTRSPENPPQACLKNELVRYAKLGRSAG